MPATVTTMPTSPRGKVVSWLSKAIREGELPRGTPVPSERKLADRLAVSRVTVKAALRDLAEMGLVDQMSSGRMRRVVAGTPQSTRASSMMQRTVAVVSTIPALDWAVPGFDAALQLDVMRKLGEAGLHALVVSPDAADQSLIDDRPAGVLLAYRVAESVNGRDVARQCRDAGVPVVIYGDGPGLEAFDRVTHDHEAGACELTRLLIQRGCRRILRFWRFMEEHHWLDQRNVGYERALREAGLPVLPAARCPALESFGSFPQRVRAFAGFLSEHVLGDEPIDGLMLATDLHALEAGTALKLLGKRPNEDVQIVGYDNAWKHWRNHEPGAADATAPLATVDKQQDLIARNLIDLLQARRQNQLPPSPQCRRISPRLNVTENVPNPLS